MRTDTRTPADLGYRPSPTRAERDTWRTPATDTNDQWLHIRPISIAPHVREANARWQESKPDSRLARELADADYYDAEDQRDADAYAAARALMDGA